MNILLNNYGGRFGNYIISIIYLINKYQIYKYNGNNKKIKIYVYKYDKELSELFDLQIYNVNNLKDGFIIEKIIWRNYNNETLLQKNVNNLTLYHKPNSKYLKVQYDNIIHLRLDDYLKEKNNKLGYYCLDDQYLTYITKKYNLNRNNCCIITSNIEDYNRIYKNRSFNVYSNSLVEDFTSMMYCKNLFCSCSTFSIMAGIVGYTKNVYVPYPYILNNRDFNKEHLFLYNNEKIIKIHYDERNP